ncbi:MAG: rRNA maturation RNase YbeY [Dehalococcoidia bacterium]|nr:rRNA maturation RNase YbeY [Dehalococcoidia bacterium]
MRTVAITRRRIATRRIDVQVFPAFRRQLTVPWLRRVAKEALAAGASSAPGEDTPRAAYRSLSLVIADDATILRLNRDYRGLNETTDVLAFASDHAGEYEGDGTPPPSESNEQFITAPEEEGFAGEVIVSYPQCLRQAAEHGHSASQELALLITHGVLHLLGYDHATPEEEQAMNARTQTALATLGLAEVVQ